MNKAVSIAFGLLFAATALIAQDPDPEKVRAELLEFIHDAQGTEVTDLWRGFATVERDPTLRAFTAGLLGIDVSELDPAPPVDLSPEAARDALITMVNEAPASELLPLAGFLRTVESEVEPFARLILTKNRGKKDNCLDHLPSTVPLPIHNGRGGHTTVHIPMAGLVKACEKQSPVRCTVVKRVVRHQIRKHTGHKCKFD